MYKNQGEDLFNEITNYVATGKGKTFSDFVEAQEQRGQQLVVDSVKLPKIVNSNTLPRSIRDVIWAEVSDWKAQQEAIHNSNIEYTAEQYKRMGIRILEDYDDLFYSVELPEGWKLEPTSHTLWSQLRDDKGRERALVFYKAAFYDREAFTRFKTRYTTEVDHCAPHSLNYEEWAASDYVGVVKDGDTVIFSTDKVPAVDNYQESSAIKCRLWKELEQYMAEHYPEYDDINAYWD